MILDKILLMFKTEKSTEQNYITCAFQSNESYINNIIQLNVLVVFFKATARKGRVENLN